MGKKNNNNVSEKTKMNLKVTDKINKARDVLKEYRAYLSVSLLSDIETHYQLKLDEICNKKKTQAEIKKIDRDIQATRKVMANEKTRQDRLSDLASHQAELEERKQALKEKIDECEKIEAEYDKLIPRALGPLQAYYKKQKLDRDVLLELAGLFDRMIDKEDLASNPLLVHLSKLYNENTNFRSGIEKARLLHRFIHCLEEVSVPKDTVYIFSKLYHDNKGQIIAHRDSHFQKAIKTVLNLLAQISPVVGLTGASKLWRSEGEKAAKKVDAILRDTATLMKK